MALVDPNIAMGYRGIQLEQRNPLQEYAQVQNIQNAQLQNQLARQQMEQEQGAVNYLRGANLATPEGRAGLRQFGKTGLAYEKMLSEQEMNTLKRQELEGKLREQRMTALGTGLTSVLKDPSDANLTAAFDRLDATGVDTKPFRASLLSEPDPLKRKATITQYVTSNPEGRQALTFVQPKPENIDLNGKIVTVDMNPNSPTYKQQIQQFTKTQTFADQNAAARLVFDQNKFNWEKANPGYELKEAEDGSIVGVNKRTLQAFPVMLGTAAPAATPAAAPAPQTGMPGTRMPAANAGQAIPGMTSVLDQQAPAAAPVAGTPLMGKGTAMTEAQSNAAMFGGAMAQAQNTIKQLEKSGTVKNAVVPGLLTGLAQMVPFGVGEGIGNVIQSTFNADPTGLIGPNAEQQKLAQAQLAFATAYLRKTSGAAFGASEVSNTIKEFFPLIGEGEKVIAQKAAARERAIEGMKMSTSKEGKKYIETYGGGGAPAAAGGGGIPGATETNPLALRIPGVTQ